MAQSVPRFDIPDKGCVGSEIFFVNKTHVAVGDTLSYNWIIADNSIAFSAKEEPNYSWLNPGTYLVQLIIEDQNGDTTSISQKITVGIAPVVDFSWDNSCVGVPIKFTVISDSLDIDITWHIEDSIVETSQLEYEYTFRSLGEKQMGLKTSSYHGCSVDLSKTIDIEKYISLDFDWESACDNDTVFYTNKSSDTDMIYHWDFGDGITDSGFHTHHVYEDPLWYNVTMSTSGFCIDYSRKRVEAREPPVATFGYNTEDNKTVYFIGPIGNDQYRWTFGDGGRSVGESPVYSYIEGSFGNEVCLASSKYGCWSRYCETIGNSIGIEESIASTSVYPNPTSGIFTVEVPVASDIYVTDMLGKYIVFSLQAIGGSYRVDLLDAPSGVYTVHFKVDDSYFYSRVLVE